MEQFAYSFAVTMMHSIWQMALLLLIYYVLVFIFRKWPPLARRNLLLVIITAQLLSSIISFYFIYSTPFLDYREDIQGLLQSLSSSQNWLQEYASVLFALYTFGLLYKLSYAWFNWRKFKGFYKNSLIKTSVDLRLFTEAKALHFGIKRKVAIWCSQHITTPVTFGFFKPVILLPVALVNQLSLQQTESLIVHELTHIKNNDYIFNWLLLIADAIFFFNPFVKIAIQHIKVEREKTCDIQVLQFNYPAINYAEALLHIAMQQQKAVQASLAAVNKKTELLDRIRYFSDDKNIGTQQTKHFSFASLFVWSFTLLNVFFAGIFVTTTKTSPSNKINTFFTAAPLNEWNRSFSAEAKYELPETNIVTTPAAENTSLAEQDYHAAIATETEQPIVEEPLTLNVAAPAEANYKLTPVAYTDPATINITVKDVIIDEEISGAKVTQAYRVTTAANGEIKMEPLWMISEIKQTSDSLKQAIKKDSSIITIMPVVQ